MRGSLIVIGLATLAQLTGSAGVKLSITRHLNVSKELPKDKWAEVEIIPGLSSVTVAFNIPVTLSYSDAFVFFANDEKKILQVHLNETIEGKLYDAPYTLNKKIKGDKREKIENDKFHEIVGSFPQEWVPEKSNKVSAALISSDGQYYNYYKVQNFQISLPDLMIVEEYAKLN